MKFPALLLLCAASSLSGAAPQFQLRDTAGALHTPGEWAGRKAVVLFFTTTDCPIANSYVPEMNRIHDAYTSRGVLFYAVQSDTSIAGPDVVRYAREFQYSYPLLFDPDQQLVELTGATLTPQVAVLSPQGNLLYLGRVDNRVEDFGKQRNQATVFDLRQALDAILAGKSVAHPRTKSIGCAITRVNPTQK